MNKLRKKSSILLVIVMAMAITTVAGCGAPSNSGTNQPGSSAGATSGTDSQGSSNYKNINENSTPIGVYDISITENTSGEQYSIINGKMKKNSDSPAESSITITFRTYDASGKYLGDITTQSSHSLTKGDFDVFEASSSIYSFDMIKNVSRAEVYKIDEVDAKTAEEEKAFQNACSNIDYALFSKKYSTAKSLLSDLKSKYPDRSADIQKLEAYIKDQYGDIDVLAGGGASPTP